MTLVLKPQGRGNWAPLVLQVTNRHVYPLFIRVGDAITLGNVTFRIAEVRP